VTYHLLAEKSGRVHVCGHRGYSLGAPENTLPALRAAREAGATGCEIDTMLTRDGELVVLHDDILDRTTDGSGPVAAHDLAAIQGLDAGSWYDPAFAGTRVPTLGEALAEARALGLGLVVEIKERERVDAAIDRLGAVLAEHDALGEVVIISFDHPSLLEVKRRIPGARTEIITHARHVDMVAVARAAKADSVSIELDMFHAGDAERLHAAGIAIRCHLPPPAVLLERRRLGLDFEPPVAEALRRRLIDTLSGDDVPFLADMVRRQSG
jgi:glycerophosphoryl diester phosphodiesterase